MPIATYGYASRTDRTALIPTLNRRGQLRSGADSSVGTYWPWVADVRHVSGRLDSWYMWTSTDHDAGAGGIGLASAPAPEGPWTDRGLVYVDTVQGSQTETPTVIWNEVEGLFFLYYQQTGVGFQQSTLLATSRDGRAWTRVGKVIDVPSATSQPGDGHTGYAMVGRIGGLWYAHHLKGGTNFPHFGLAYSYDGREWHLDPRSLGYGAHIVAAGTRIEWNHGNVVWWAERLWWIGPINNFSSGSAAKAGHIGAAPISADLRQLIGRPITLWRAMESWETPDLRAVTAITDNGRLLVYYLCGDRIGLLTSEVLP